MDCESPIKMGRTDSGWIEFSRWPTWCLVVLAAVGGSFFRSLPAVHGEQPSEDRDRPNVVMFFIDDLGSLDVGCYGSEFYDTPNIDRLAQSGAQFTQFYSAHPVCSPTRAALMTGKVPQRMGITQWIPQPSDIHLPLEETTIAEAFKSAGYRTGYIGKWHLGEGDDQQPSAHGFDWQKGVNRAGQPASYFYPYRRQARSQQKNYWNVPDFEEGQSGDYLTDQLTNAALEFIDSAGDQPFFLCLAHYAVHTPIQSPKPLVERYQEKKEERFGRQVLPLVPEKNGAASRPRQDNPAYAAMISNLDDNVGRVLEHLQENGLSEDTIVVFTSDNGGLSTLRNGRVGPTSCRPLRAGKGWNYEGGIRIPTLISWPGQVPSGLRVKESGITMDLYPTLLDLAGLTLKPAQHLDGISFKERLTGPAEGVMQERFLAWHYPHDHGSGHTPSSALRQGSYKLLFRPDGPSYELYHLVDDPSETIDLSQSEPRRVKEMAHLLDVWLKETSQPPVPD